MTSNSVDPGDPDQLVELKVRLRRELFQRLHRYCIAADTGPTATMIVALARFLEARGA